MLLNSMEFPASVTVMVLPSTVFFPHTLLPLYIFEPRYRKMLRDALASHRMFAVALADAQGDEVQPAPVGSIGFIRACVHNEDGTSNLILQGIARIHLEEFLSRDPVFTVPVDPLCDEEQVCGEAKLLARAILDRTEKLSRKHAHPPGEIGGCLKDCCPHTLADIVAGNFVRDLFARQQILEEPRAVDRLRLLDEALRRECSACE
jgi:Lon protease-like protein